jgi:hypothetical protein
MGASRASALPLLPLLVALLLFVSIICDEVRALHAATQPPTRRARALRDRPNEPLVTAGRHSGASQLLEVSPCFVF